MEGEGTIGAEGSVRSADPLSTTPPALEATGTYDVFLSYSRSDGPVVLRIAETLHRNGLRPWLDVWATTGGVPWPEELAEGLRLSRSCAVFVGPSGTVADASPGAALSDWEREELRVAVDRAAKDPSFRVFLVLLEGVAEPFDASGLLPFLSMRTWVDMRRGSAHPRALQQLMHAIRGIPFGPEAQIDQSDDVCPYQGLATFQEGDARFFFGREAETQRVIEKLKSWQFIAVFGPSGSGKSSLIRAGVLPEVRAGAVPGGETWDIRTFTPGSRPLDTLAGYLSRADPDLMAGHVRDQLAADTRTLRMLSAARSDAKHLLLVVDQFEEVFTLCSDDRERRQFIGNILEATAPDTSCSVVLTVRADFYPRFAAYPEFAQRVSDHQFLVGPMDTDSLRQVVEAPAHLVGLQFEPGLVDTILDDVGQEAGALPLLEHALLEVWRRRLGTTLTLEGYHDAGGVAGALAKRAESTWESLSPAERGAAQRVMLRLTRPGEGAEDTRQRAFFEELISDAEDEDTVREVVRELADARLLAVNVDLRSERVLVDVTHEALIRGWPRLRAWIDENREGLRTRQRLTQAAREWGELGRDEGALYRGARLAAAREWAETAGDQLNQLERAFLSASMAAEAELVAEEHRRAERERLRAEKEARSARRFRTLALGLGVLLVAAVAATAFAAVQTERARTAARQNAADALAERALNLVGTQTDLALLLGLEAMELAPTSAVRGSFLQTVVDTARIDAFLHGHTGEVLTAEPSPVTYDLVGERLVPGEAGSVRLVASSGEDGTVRLWDFETRRAVGEPLTGHEGRVWTVAFSPDGRLLASAGADGRILLWDVATGQRMGSLEGHTDEVFTVRFRPPDGRVLASSSADGSVRLWDVEGQTELAVQASGVDTAAAPEAAAAPDAGAVPDAAPAPGSVPAEGIPAAERDDVRHVAFSSDGTRLATAHGDGSIRLWDGRDAQPVAAPVPAHDSPVADLEFAARDSVLVSGARDGGVRFWGVEDDQLQLRSERFDHDGHVYAVAVSNDGRQAATGGFDGDIMLWDTSDAEPLGSALHANDREVLSLAFDSGGRLVSAGGDEAVVGWDVEGNVAPFLGRDLPGRRLVATAGTLVAGHGDGRVVWHDHGTLEELAAAQPTGEQVTAMAARGPTADTTLASGAATVAVGWADGTVQLYEAPNRLSRIPPLEHPARVTALAFSPVAPLLVSGADDGALRVWDLERGAVIATLQHDQRVWGLAVGPEGRWVASAGEYLHARLWDLPGASEGETVPPSDTDAGHDDEVAAVAFSPDGDLLATGSYDGTVGLWEFPSGSGPVHELRGAGSRVTAVAFSPDGRSVLATTEEGAVAGWDVPTGRLLWRVDEGHTGWTWGLGVGPAGNPLSASDDEQAVVWNRLLLEGDLDDWRAHVCDVAGRVLTRTEWTMHLGNSPYRPSCTDGGEGAAADADG